MVGSLFSPLIIIPKKTTTTTTTVTNYYYLIRWLFIGFILGIDCGNSMK